MIAVIGGVKTCVSVRMTMPERDIEKQRKQDEEALLNAGIDINNMGDAEEDSEDARFRRYYEGKMREMASDNYWNEVGLGGGDFGGYPVMTPDEDTDIRVSSSGCSYNVARRLGGRTELAFVSVVGNDALGMAALCELEKAGVDVSAVKIAEGATPVGVELHNVVGDLNFLRENNSLMGELSPKLIDESAELLDRADVIFMDGSLSVETMNYVSEKYADKCKICFDPASINGGSRFAESDLKAYLVIPGRMEAEAMTGLQILGMDQLMAAGTALEERGVKNTIITLKGGGIYYREGTEAEIIKPEKVLSFADTSGAGDVLSAEVVYRLSLGDDLAVAAKAAMDETAEYLKEVAK
ncbi:MAG: PfkB family carbohydrate kinase [Bacillota bacterium]|nr:PfkB family carbohydrate kinase [Bacillota bacterium]